MSNVVGVKIVGDSSQFKLAIKDAGQAMGTFAQQTAAAKAPLDSLSNAFKTAFIGGSLGVG